MFWALIIIACTDYNNCVIHKRTFTSEGECRAEIPYTKPPLTTYICQRQGEEDATKSN